jgi:hypothetical protein
MVEIRRKHLTAGLQLLAASSHRGAMVQLFDIGTYLQDSLNESQIYVLDALFGEANFQLIYAATGISYVPSVGIALVAALDSTPSFGSYALPGTGFQDQSLEDLLYAVESTEEAVAEDIGNSYKTETAFLRGGDSYVTTSMHVRFNYTVGEAIKQKMRIQGTGRQIKLSLVAYSLVGAIPAADWTILCAAEATFRLSVQNSQTLRALKGW